MEYSDHHMFVNWVYFPLTSKRADKKLKCFLQNPLIILATMVRNALEDECFSAHVRVCAASGREVHGHSFLSSRGSVIPVMIDLCSLSGDNKPQRTAGRQGDPTAAGCSLQSIMCLTTGKGFSSTKIYQLPQRTCECKRKIWKRKHPVSSEQSC